MRKLMKALFAVGLFCAYTAIPQAREFQCGACEDHDFGPPAQQQNGPHEHWDVCMPQQNSGYASCGGGAQIDTPWLKVHNNNDPNWQPSGWEDVLLPCTNSTRECGVEY